jgi:hypothetical protein
MVILVGLEKLLQIPQHFLRLNHLPSRIGQQIRQSLQKNWLWQHHLRQVHF